MGAAGAEPAEPGPRRLNETVPRRENQGGGRYRWAGSCFPGSMWYRDRAAMPRSYRSVPVAGTRLRANEVSTLAAVGGMPLSAAYATLAITIVLHIGPSSRTTLLAFRFRAGLGLLVGSHGLFSVL